MSDAIKAYQDGKMRLAVGSFVALAKKIDGRQPEELETFEEICFMNMKKGLKDLSSNEIENFATILQNHRSTWVKRQEVARERASPPVIRASDAARYLAQRLCADEQELPQLRRHRVQNLMFFAEAVHHHALKRPMFSENPVAEENGPAYLSATSTLLECIPDSPPSAVVSIATLGATLGDSLVATDVHVGARRKDNSRVLDAAHWLPRFTALLDAADDVLKTKTTREIIDLSRDEIVWRVCRKIESRVMTTALMAQAYATKHHVQSAVVQAVLEKLRSG